MITHIDSINNSKIKMYTKLHQKKYRDEFGYFIVEEDHLISEAIKKDCLETLIIRSDLNNIFNFENVIYVSEAVINKLSDNKSNSKYIGICKKLKENYLVKSRVILVDGIQDGGNLGTIIRTCVAFGFNQIIISNDSVDIYNEKVIKASQGSLFYINFIRMDLLEAIKKLKVDGFEVISLSLNNSIDIEDLKEVNKMAFILGNEGNGIKKEIEDASDKKARIDIDFESLNVAIAGSIVMYKYKKREL